MANVDYLVIRIEGQSEEIDEEGLSAVSGIQAILSANEQKQKEINKQEKTRKKNIQKFSAKSWQQVYSIGKNALTMGWNRYTTLQEDYLAENRVNNIMQAVEKTTNLATNVSGMAITGAAVGGPIGAAVGATIGAVGWGIKEYQQNQQKLSSYYQQLNETNFQTYLDSSRAGLVNNGRGTEN